MPEKFDLAYYLTKLKNHKVEPLEKVLQKDGQLNDIDYHLEIMKKYYPDYKHGGPLRIKCGFEGQYTF